MPNVQTEAFQIYPLPGTCNYTEGPTTEEALLSSSLLSPNMLSFVRSIPSFAAAADGFAFRIQGEEKKSRGGGGGGTKPRLDLQGKRGVGFTKLAFVQNK